jgi:uncharacterized protein
MTGLNLLPVFLIGLLGSVHCVGMCGGIVSAFSVASQSAGDRRRRFPVPVIATSTSLVSTEAIDTSLRVLSYNAGRISSYALAGAAAGGIAQGARALSWLSSLEIGAYWLANIMLVLLGLYLMDAWRGLSHLEDAGRTIWRRIKPLMKHFLPMNTPAKAFALGGLWGWVPCGMVYSVLLTAMLTGSATSGAAVMIAFGLGTLPTLLGIGMVGARLQALTRRRAVRVASGLIVLAFGILGMYRAANGLSLGWLDAVCISPWGHG